MIVRAASLAEAEALARSEPFEQAGMRANTVKGWRLNEGCYSVTLRYSERTFDTR